MSATAPTIMAIAMLAMLMTMAYAPQPAPYPYVAAFLQEKDVERCVKLFGRSVSDAQETLCDHTTYVYHPQSLMPYMPYMGDIVTLTVLGHASTKENNSLLISASSVVQTKNPFPHITVDAYKDGPYAAQYSNVLWTRATSADIARVSIARNGKPYNLTLPGDSRRFVADLPPFYSKEDPLDPPTKKPFPVSRVDIKLPSDPSDPIQFSAMLCLDRWFRNGTCVVDYTS